MSEPSRTTPRATLSVALTRLRLSIEGPDRLPLAWTLRGYTRDRIAGDTIAGLTVAALIVPLTIGYAVVAGLPPEMGLYASVAPLLVYAILGSGRRLIVGPDAASAAMIGATLAPLAATADERARLASMLALMVALVFVAMRLARMGFLADFLSRPILVGYLAGVGLSVVAGQVEKILGGPAIADALNVLRNVDPGAVDPAALAEAVRVAIAQSGADLISLALGGGVLAAVLIGRRLLPGVPIVLPAMLVALVLSAWLDLQSHGVDVLGPVPSGLPPLALPSASIDELFALLPGALGLAILTFADTTATGRSFAARHGERTDANRELVALAAADAATSITGGYPVSSSPSRTAASEAAGSTSGLAGIVAAAAVLVVLVLLTGPLAVLPIPALGAVIFASVLGLIDLPQLRAIWRIKRSEGAIALVAMGGVIVYGTLAGVLVAVLLAALNVVRLAASPPIVEEIRRPDGTWRDASRAAGPGRRVAGVVVVRFAGPLFFANASALTARVRAMVAAREDATAVVVDMGAVSYVDLTAADALRDIERELARGGRRFAAARPLGNVRDLLRANGLEGLMSPTEGTRGSVDATIRGLGLDPERSLDDDAAADADTAADHEAGSLLAWPTANVDPVAVRVVAVAVAVVGGAVLLGLAVAAWTSTPPPGPTAVPNLVGMSLSRAEQAAEDAGFVLEEAVYVRRADAPEGTVVAQDPPAGTVADLGTAIQPIVSTGHELLVVPDVVGLPEAEAIVTLTSAGLSVRRLGTQSSPDIPAGAIVSTDPPALTSVTAGTSVGYVVSSGP